VRLQHSPPGRHLPTELVRSHRQVRSVAQPRANLVVKAGRLQLGHDALKAAEVRLRQQGRDESRRGASTCPNRPFKPPKLSNTPMTTLTPVAKDYGRFSFFAARDPAAVATTPERPRSVW